MSDIWFYSDKDSTLMIRTPFNKMEGVFKLYKVGESDVDATMTIAKRENEDIVAAITISVARESDISSTIDIKYRGNHHLSATFDVIGANLFDSYLEIRPNNRMFAIFEILPPPREYKQAYPTQDSTTRSRSDLLTINYGDSQRMMAGISKVGTDEEEYMESFVRFESIADYLQDMQLLEKANLRLYYVGDFVDGVDLSLYLPDEYWYEFGVTHANRPEKVELITSAYTINKTERYVEFDIKEMVLKWRNKEIENLGVILASGNNYATSFYTREGRMKPLIDIQYISNKIYNPGRDDRNATMFIWGVGHADLNSRLEVHSDRGWDERDSTLYVHRPESPVPYDRNSWMILSKPDQHAKMTVAIRDKNEIAASLTIYAEREDIRQSKVVVSKPDLTAHLTVDPNMSLEASITVSWDEEDLREATLAVTRDELIGRMRIIGVDIHNQDAIIEVPHYSHVESTIAITRDELFGYLDVHTIDQREATLYVKHREDAAATMYIRAVSAINATIDVKRIDQIDASITASKKHLWGFLYPRLAAESDLRVTTKIRQRDASDLGSSLIVGGTFGAYYFII